MLLDPLTGFKSALTFNFLSTKGGLLCGESNKTVVYSWQSSLVNRNSLIISILMHRRFTRQNNQLRRTEQDFLNGAELTRTIVCIVVVLKRDDENARNK